MRFVYDKHVADPGGFRPTEDGDIRRLVYLNLSNGISLRNHLAVKNSLLDNPDLVEEYSKIKMDLAKQEFENIGGYVAGKDDILKKILERSDLTKEDLKEIFDAAAIFNGPPTAKKI